MVERETTTRDDVEGVKRALLAYGERLMHKCEHCGAEIGQRCVTIGGTSKRLLDAPHKGRGSAER